MTPAPAEKQKTIVMLCSLDTKGDEALYLRDCIEEQGLDAVLVDIGYGQAATVAATVSADDLARLVGSTIEEIRGMKDTGEASQLIMQGAILKVGELHRQRRCDGVIGFGGASNATLASGVMKTLPVGLPKLILTSAAGMPAYAARFFNSRDITVMNAIVDISGLNELTRMILQQGAGGICGMAACHDRNSHPVQADNMIAVTSFRFAETCCQHVILGLERLGYTVIPFHAQGVGEDTLEELVSDGLFEGVVDIVPAGLSEQLLGGNRAARPQRLEAAGRAGVPHVLAPSGFDMISCGPIERRDSDDPLWRERGIHARRISIPDRYRVEARTSADEVTEIAGLVAEKLNRAGGPACVLVPRMGWSSLSTEGEALYDPGADAPFAPTLRAALHTEIPVIEMQCELNSEEFARALVERMHAMVLARRKNAELLHQAEDTE